MSASNAEPLYTLSVQGLTDDCLHVRRFRGREAISAAYSFDIDDERGKGAYNRMFVAYLRAFKRMGLQAVPVFHSIARWPNAMAQYTVGHEQRLKQIESMVKEIPGLHLAGNGYRVIGLPDCIKAGKEAATRITS